MFERFKSKSEKPKKMLFKLEGSLNTETGNYICHIPHFNVVFLEDGTCVGAYNPDENFSEDTTCLTCNYHERCSLESLVEDMASYERSIDNFYCADWRVKTINTEEENK